MRDLTQQLSDYAAYHSDRRNIATHFLGIPMIVVSVTALLSRSVLGSLGPVHVSVAEVLAVGACLFYLRTSLRLGAVMTLLMALAVAAGASLSALPRSLWLGAALGLLVVGWAAQFLGHFFEGRKPAFVDDLSSLLVGPLFLVAEAAFALGLLASVREAVEARAGLALQRKPTVT